MIPGITINPNGSISTKEGIVLTANKVKALIKDFQEQQHKPKQFVTLGRQRISGSLQTLLYPIRANTYKVGCIEFTRDEAIGFINEYQTRTQSIMDTQVHDGMRLRGKRSNRTFVARYIITGVCWVLITEDNCTVWRSCHAPETEAPLLRDFFGSAADSFQVEILKT